MGVAKRCFRWTDVNAIFYQHRFSEECPDVRNNLADHLLKFQHEVLAELEVPILELDHDVLAGGTPKVVKRPDSAYCATEAGVAE